ncbi:MAG TPA: hypothetical protein VJL83_03245 [Patescibacteria group bacterium]|nr:hypothetical protein [Patescibacteria group bacterium]
MFSAFAKGLSMLGSLKKGAPLDRAQHVIKSALNREASRGKRGVQNLLGATEKGFSSLLGSSSQPAEQEENRSVGQQTARQVQGEFMLLLKGFSNPVTAVPLLITLVLVLIFFLAFQLVLPAAPIPEGADRFL